MKKFSNTNSFARRAVIAALSRLGACWRSRVRITALVLVAVLFSTCVGQESRAQAVSKAKSTGIVAAVVAPPILIGVGVYFVIQSAHTVKGCVTDNPNGLLLHLGDGKVYILLGATTNIKADTRIKVRGTRKKKIIGLTDQPTFVVERLGKVYGSCSVSTPNP